MYALGNTKDVITYLSFFICSFFGLFRVVFFYIDKLWFFFLHPVHEKDILSSLNEKTVLKLHVFSDLRQAPISSQGKIKKKQTPWASQNTNASSILSL